MAALTTRWLRAFARLFRMLVKVDLLVMDDFGPDGLTAGQRRDLMQIKSSVPQNAAIGN